MDKRTEFVDSLKVDIPVDIPNEEELLKDLLDKKYEEYAKIYENKNMMYKAFQYYKIAADMNESWALNKVGEYYRKNNNLEHAYIYYKKAIECPLKERNRYAYYNLATYYYKDGFKALNIKKSKDKYDEYMGMYKKLKK